MGRRGRPRHPDILTPREWEVLELLRERLSNEQIAERLGISLDGAKYHVSQILSKLGVPTREEAAVWRPEERRARWMRWPVWAKIASAATIAGAALGLAILAWGVLRTTHTDEVASLRDNPLYGRVVYLAPGDESLWIAPPEQVSEAGISTTSNPEEFRQAVTRDTAAIIIDRDWIAAVDVAWVRQMVADGKVLVGARVNLSDLAATFNVGGTSAFDRYPYPSSRLFYSMVSQPTCADRQWRIGGAAVDYLDRNQRGQFRLLIHRLNNQAQNQCVDPLADASNVGSEP